MNVGDGPARLYAHLLNVVIQGHDGQRRRQAGAGGDGGPHRRRLADVAMVTGLQEVGCLVIFIQNFDLEVGERRQRVTIVLLRLDGGGRIIEPCFD